MSAHGPIPPLPPVSAPAHIMAAARLNCAERLRGKGHEVEAQCFERGERDDAFAMRHEVSKLLTLQGAGQ